MQDKKGINRLSDSEEAECAYFIENPIALCRVVQLMPHGNPTLDFLQKLYSYAVMRNRKVDLANALIGHDGRCGDIPRIKLDWYRECNLPGRCPDFFLEVERYAWTRAQIAADEFDEDDLDAVDARLEEIENIKNDIGDGLVDMEDVLTQIRLRRNGIVKAVQAMQRRGT